MDITGILSRDARPRHVSDAFSIACRSRVSKNSTRLHIIDKFHTLSVMPSSTLLFSNHDVLRPSRSHRSMHAVVNCAIFPPEQQVQAR